MLSVIIPSRTDAFCERLLQSIAQNGSGQREVVVVDSGLSPEFRYKWQSVIHFVPFPNTIFNFSQAVNLGVDASRPSDELLLINDDCEILTPDYARLCEQVLTHPLTQKYGVISLRVDGGVGNEEQRDIIPGTLVQPSARTVCFVAVLIRREAWNQVGPMDLGFPGSFSDDDWCFRARAAGWQCGITGLVTVRHGFPGKSLANSYSRYMRPDEHQAQSRKARDYFRAKHGRLADPAHENI